MYVVVLVSTSYDHIHPSPLLHPRRGGAATLNACSGERGRSVSSHRIQAKIIKGACTYDVCKSKLDRDFM